MIWPIALQLARFSSAEAHARTGLSIQADDGLHVEKTIIVTSAQVIVFAILATTIALFLWGRWRHDMVALAALLACVVGGVVRTEDAFSGFSHPAVITVACVLVLSRALQVSGAFEAIAHHILPASLGPTATIAALTAMVTIPSAFMNNVGALALIMPMAIQVAARNGIPPGRVLMPVAFGSILGGMTTLIGTPPNLIVSSFRQSTGQESFAMFDFAPVGVAVAMVGVAFITLIGWRLVPHRERGGTEDFETGGYLTEARVPDGAKAAGMTLREVEAVLEQADAQIVGVIRNGVRLSAPNPARRVKASDILVIEADPKSLSAALSSLGLQLEEAVSAKQAKAGENDDTIGGDAAKSRRTQAAEGEARPSKPSDETYDTALMELAVLPDSDMLGRSAADIRLRTNFGINLLALSRQGRRSIKRLRQTAIKAGDVLLIQGPPDSIYEFANRYGCVPLAERALTLPNRREAMKAGLIMLVSVGAAALGLVPAAISFTAGLLASMVFRTIPLRKVYDAIDWPLIVLLGALIPVAGAMASTGAAELLGRALLDHVTLGNSVAALAVILVVTMTLSDFMNNAATAAVMCPIALGTAQNLGVNSDPFLMAVAIGASCAFLTPIGHQNNLLIMGPGGFRFGDYWRLGLPLEIIVVAVSIPLVLLVWPL